MQDLRERERERVAPCSLPTQEQHVSFQAAHTHISCDNGGIMGRLRYGPGCREIGRAPTHKRGEGGGEGELWTAPWLFGPSLNSYESLLSAGSANQSNLVQISVMPTLISMSGFAFREYAV
jgi:hypothetical protein